MGLVSAVKASVMPKMGSRGAISTLEKRDAVEDMENDPEVEGAVKWQFYGQSHMALDGFINRASRVWCHRTRHGILGHGCSRSHHHPLRYAHFREIPRQWNPTV